MADCPGPLVWFPVDETSAWEPAGILKCATCDYLIVTGTFNDDAHVGTPLLMGA